MTNYPVKAKLIALTQPVIGVPAASPEELMAYCARVSSERKEEERGKDHEWLLKYCMKNKHWSVFEMANAVVEVQAPRDISRQLLRHRSFSFQELSQRYSSDMTFCTRDIRMQDTKNRQNSVDSFDETTKSNFKDQCDWLSELSRKVYNQWLDGGAAKECARVFLPEGLTMSTLYINGTIRSWLHYLDIRDDEGHSQREHVMLARAIRKEIIPALPTLLGENK